MSEILSREQVEKIWVYAQYWEGDCGAKLVKSNLALLDENERLRKACNKEFASVEMLDNENQKLKQQLESIWKHCKVIYFAPKSAHNVGDYPIEHAPRANKDSRRAIEAALLSQEPSA